MEKEKSRSLKIDANTKMARLEIVKTVDVTEVYDEQKLKSNRDYLTDAIEKFQEDLTQVNDKLTQIENERAK